MEAPTSFLKLAREITLGHAADVLERGSADIHVLGPDGPRRCFLAACLRLEAEGIAEGATARRIYSRSDLADEIALPDVEAAGRIIRVLNGVGTAEAHAAARNAIAAICDLLAPPLGGAA